MVKNTIREYIILSILFRGGMSMIAATYVLFLISHGLNYFEVNLVNFAFFATLFICEIPTGAFADVFGRKASFITACGLLATGMAVYAVSVSFWGFVVAEMISAIGATFASGAFRAWFVDKLRHHGHEGTLTSVFAKVDQVGQASTIVFALIGSYLAEISMSLPWFIGAVVFCVAGIVALFLKEEYFVHRKFSFKDGFMAMMQTVSSGLAFGSRSKKVRFVLIISVAQIFTVQGPNMQWQPFFNNYIPSKMGMGYMWAGMSFCLMLGIWLAPKLLRQVPDERKALSWCQLVIGLGIATTTLTAILPIAITLFLLHEVARGTIQPVKAAYLHDNIPSKERATIDSFDSMSHHGGGMVGLLVSGFLALVVGIPWTWSILGTTLIIVTLLIRRNGNKNGH